MKIKHLTKKILPILLSLLIVVGLTSTVFAAFGPDRPTKAWNPSVDGFDHVTFNSFTGVGNGIGDERDFMRGVQVGRDSVWSDPVANVTQDAEVEAKVYIHNGADARLNDQPGNPGVAKNVRIKVDIPTELKQSQDTFAYITADNAQPGTIYDTLTTTGANNGYFNLEYVPGSAKLHYGGTATALSDSLVTTGVNIGDIKGCFDYVREVTFRMKVKMPHYTVKKQVRYEGQTKNDWKESINVKRGQTVEWKVEFDNIGRTVLNHVVLLDQLPVNVTVVPGSVKLIDGNFPSGYVFKDEDAVQNKGTQINVDIGSVNPGINSILAFKTKINDAPELKCGKHELVNTAYATPNNPKTSIKDSASVIVEGEVCAETPPTAPPTGKLPDTGAGSVAGIFAGTSLAGAFLHRRWTIRRNK